MSKRLERSFSFRSSLRHPSMVAAMSTIISIVGEPLMHLDPDRSNVSIQPANIRLKKTGFLAVGGAR